MTFWVLYDHLGKLVLANLLCSMVLVFPGWMALNALLSEDAAIRLLMGLPLMIVTLGVLAPVGAAGIAYMAKVLIETRDGSLADFWTGIRRFWGRAICIGLLFTLITCSLATSVWFYAHTLGQSLSWLGYGVSGLAAWCLIFELLVSLLVIPALVQKNGRLIETVKLASLLVLDNPLFAAGLAGQILALSALLIIPPVFFLLYGAMVVVLASSAYEMLARKYAAIEMQHTAEVQGVTATTARAKTAAVVDDAQDDYLNRGFRDFLFPWKG
ncbi:MAG: hypothetical protein HZB26_02155 [Candidatus Hydrogenedentes bacterium]|nr:hypothetical protein [Candidatus Hydrogenedentota bacterium]